MAARWGSVFEVSAEDFMFGTVATAGRDGVVNVGLGVAG